MRIITFVCCTAVLLPSFELNALAKPIDRYIADQNQLSDSTESILFSSLMVQNEDLSFDESTTTADNYWNKPESLDRNEIENVKFQLQDISQRNFEPNRGAPGLTLVNPYGFGADSGSRFAGIGFTSDSRYGNDDADAAMGFGIGFGDAQNAIGVELSYVLASFGAFDRDFGTGGFNAKIHRQLADGWGVAAGWDGFLNIGDENDFDDSIYVATTKLLRTKKDLNAPFSRIAVTAGIGNGAFRSEDAIANDDEEFNVFGSLAVRVAQPVSFITEWTGQDLGMGVSVAPLKRVPLTVNLGLRDIAGAGDGVRFVGGLGLGF